MATNSVDNSLNNSLNNDRGAIPLNDAFGRLRWSIFENVSSILILDDPKTQSPDLSPFVGHAIAAEPASKTPLTEIAFSINDLDAYDLPGYTSPEPLPVSRADGGIVTVADVVEQLSAYFQTHKEDILMVKESFLGKSPCRFVVDGKVETDATATLGEGEEIPTDTKVFFEGFLGIIEPTMEELPILLWAEGEGPSRLDKRLRR